VFKHGLDLNVDILFLPKYEYFRAAAINTYTVKFSPTAGRRPNFRRRRNSWGNRRQPDFNRRRPPARRERCTVTDSLRVDVSILFNLNHTKSMSGVVVMVSRSMISGSRGPSRDECCSSAGLRSQKSVLKYKCESRVQRRERGERLGPRLEKGVGKVEGVAAGVIEGSHRGPVGVKGVEIGA
jgi:hypothetical protein